MLKQRIVTAVIALIALLLIVFVVPPAGTRTIIAILMLAAAWEWAGFLTLTNGWMRLVYVALVGVAGGFLWFVLDPSYFETAMQVALTWWTLAFVWIFFYPTAIPTAFAWLAGTLVIIPAWLALDRLYLGGALLLLTMLGIVWAADIGAYFAGKRFGRVKLAPQVSPGKTWEGVIGGMVAVAVLAVAVATLAGQNLLIVLPLCLAVAVISIVGDLTVSIFKRNAGLKDSGKLFPGHGGILDRIDGVTAAAPVFVYGLSLAGLS